MCSIRETFSWSHQPTIPGKFSFISALLVQPFYLYLGAKTVKALERLKEPHQSREVGIEAHEFASSSTADKPERTASFRVFLDQVISENRLANIKTTSVSLVTSRDLLILDAVVSISG